jgi:hypothetical protein
MLTSYGIGDALLTAFGVGGGILAGKYAATALNVTGVGEAVLIAGGSTTGAYAALHFREPPSPDAKPQIPEEGEEARGLFASTMMALSTYLSLVFLGPAGPAIQYAGSAAAGTIGTITYSVSYETAGTLQSLKKPSKSSPPKKKNEDEEEDEEEEEKEEEEYNTTSFDDYVLYTMSHEKASPVFMC